MEFFRVRSKQPASELLLQELDLAAHGGLRHIQPLGRLRKRHAICGSEKI